MRSLTALLLTVLLHWMYTSSVGEQWYMKELSDASHSVAFASTSGFECPSIQCISTFKEFHVDPYVHFMVKFLLCEFFCPFFSLRTHDHSSLFPQIGTTHPSSLPLAVYRLCDLFQHCLDKRHFLLTGADMALIQLMSTTWLINFLPNPNLFQFTYLPVALTRTES